MPLKEYSTGDSAKIESDDLIKEIERASGQTLSQIVADSLKAFRRDLPELLARQHGQWVAYHGDKMIACGSSQIQLYNKCHQEGYDSNTFVVRRVVRESQRDVDVREPVDG